MGLTIVGIGASAGGLEAITELLGALPATTGMAYVVVQHLDPRHESLLSEILAKKTPIPVTAAVSGEIVGPIMSTSSRQTSHSPCSPAGLS